MPVKKVGKKWEVNGTEYDSEAAAETAYKASLALKFGITDVEAGAKAEKDEDKKAKKSTKKKSKKDKKEEDDEEHSHED